MKLRKLFHSLHYWGDFPQLLSKRPHDPTILGPQNGDQTPAISGKSTFAGANGRERFGAGGTSNPFINGSDLELPPGFDQHILA